jgi:transmembrane sensor
MRLHAATNQHSALDNITRQAAEWLVRLSADSATSSDYAVLLAEYEKWKQADPRHAEADEKMASLIDQTQQLRNVTPNTAPARAAIEAGFTENRKRSHIKSVGAALVLVLALAVPGWLILQSYRPAYLLADMRTAPGKWETRTLTDDSRITLNSASAVNLDFDASRRGLTLVRGEILVDVAADPARPFLVETVHGSIRALGTRFVVSLDADATTLTMLESSTIVQAVTEKNLQGEAEDKAMKNTNGTIVNAGQRVRITSKGIGEVENIDARAISDARQFRQLVVENRPLPEVLDELARYRPGFIRYDRSQIENMKVSAVLPLDDPDKALQLLAGSFPIRVHTVTSWLVIIDVTDVLIATDTSRK